MTYINWVSEGVVFVPVEPLVEADEADQKDLDIAILHIVGEEDVVEKDPTEE